MQALRSEHSQPLQQKLEHHRRIFGEGPQPISSVAIMTDTDHTGASATTLYKDIVFKGNNQ
jgi:hypothetical protein